MIFRRLACALVLAACAPGSAQAHHAATPGEVRALVLQQAQAAIDTPYRYGARGQGAFDCSGLIQWAYAAAHVDLPRTSREILKRGVSVPLDQVQPGDLLVYDWGSRSVSSLHLTIITAPGEVIHASPKYKKVRSTRVDNPWWKRRLVAAIRVLPVES